MDKIIAAREAIHAAGGQSQLAKQLAAEINGLTEKRALWRIQKWYYNGVAPSFCPLVEKFSGISRVRLQPDLYRDTT